MNLKKQVFGRLAMLTLLLSFASLAAYAQSAEPFMRVQIPFDFEVGERSLPAGKYVIKRDKQLPQFLWIQSPNRKVTVRTFTTAHSLPLRATRSSLIFKVLGERHFLAEVKDAPHGLAYSTMRPKEERRLAQAQIISLIPNDIQTND